MFNFRFLSLTSQHSCPVSPTEYWDLFEIQCSKLLQSPASGTHARADLSLPYGISPTPITLTGLVFQALPY